MRQHTHKNWNPLSARLVRRAIVIVALACTASVQGAAAQEADVLAIVNGTPITMREVDAKAGAALAKLNEQLFALRKAQLDTLIEDRLIAAEAARRGVTPEALVATEITARVQTATAADASAFYEANKAKLQGATFAQIQDQITTYLTSQRLSARRQEFVATLKGGADVKTFLVAPEPYRADVSLEGAYVRGNANAPVTIVEFSDFHCPFCRKADPILHELMTRYGDKVRLVYKDMPLDNLHPSARAAAEAALCAGAQGKFWDFHDKLIAAEPDASPAVLDRLGQEVGLDLPAFKSCYASRQFKARVQASAQEGARLGVTGTPTFFINGRALTGAQPVEAFARIIDEELQRHQ